MSKDRPAGRKFRISIMGIVCLAISLAGGMIPLYADQGVDITFFHVADPHYRAFDTTANGSNKVIRANVERMKEIPGATLPNGLGTVGQPLGVIVGGDIIQGPPAEECPETGEAPGHMGTRERQWANFVGDFGLTGKEGALDYPVYEGFGNHDQDSFVRQIMERVAERNKTRPGVKQVSAPYQYPEGSYGGIRVEGVHYAWQWGPVHFIQANMRVGDSPRRYPAGGSLRFLRTYLTEAVGDSGAPVIISHHLPSDTGQDGEWPQEDRDAYHALIKDYNVVAILSGHKHSFRPYSPWEGIREFQADGFGRRAENQGFMTVFRIVSDPQDPAKGRLIAAQRLVNGTWGQVVVDEIRFAAPTAR